MLKYYRDNLRQIVSAPLLTEHGQALNIANIEAINHPALFGTVQDFSQIGLG